MRKNRFSRGKKQREEMVLQITSMADIMTILLVFLLKSFSTGISVITPSANLTLPEAVAGDTVAELLKMEISKDMILIDDKPVTKMTNFQFSRSEIDADGTPRTLNAALMKERARHIAEAKSKLATSGKKATPENNPENVQMILLADQKVPYSTLKTILSSVGSVGFQDLKFAVVQEQ